MIDDVIIERVLKGLFLDSDFAESYYNALDDIHEDLCHLWGSPEAVSFGSYIKKLKELPNELNEAIYDLGLAALEELKAKINDYDKTKSDLRMYCSFAKHLENKEASLKERIEDSRFQETAEIQFGMNKEQASKAMDKFLEKINVLLPSLDDVARSRSDAFRVFGVSINREYENKIEEIKCEIVETVREMKETFEKLKNKETDNSMIGRDYTIVSR